MVFFSKTQNLSILLVFSIILGSCASIERGREKKDTDTVIWNTSSVQKKSKTKKTEKSARTDGVSSVKTGKNSLSHKTVDTISQERTPKEEHKKRDDITEPLPENSNKIRRFPFNGIPYNGHQLLAKGQLLCENKKSSFGTIPTFKNDKVIDSGKVKRRDNNNSVNNCLLGYKNNLVYTNVGGGFLCLHPILPSNENPCMTIYLKYDPVTKVGKIDYNISGTSWVYMNGDQILYRWKTCPDDSYKTGILGIEILLKKFSLHDFKKNSMEHFNAQIHYSNNGNDSTATFSLLMEKQTKNYKFGI